MGAEYITGSFSSSDWKESIRKLQQQATRYIRLADGSYEEDPDCYYDGTIYSIEHWNYREMHNDTLENVKRNIREYARILDKWDGIVIEHQLAGYELYRPTFEKIDKSIPNYRIYFDGRLTGYVALEQVGAKPTSSKCGTNISVVKYGMLDDCKKEVAELLYLNLNKVYIICNTSGKLIRCYNKIRRVKETTQKSEWGKLKVRPVYSYYWGGWAAT